jgi:hypothetical protein
MTFAAPVDVIAQFGVWLYVALVGFTAVSNNLLNMRSFRRTDAGWNKQFTAVDHSIFRSHDASSD